MDHHATADILIVEDNRSDVELMMRVFQRNHLSDRVVVLEDGAAAIEYLFGKGAYAGRDLGTRPKVVLLDIKMPRVGGFEVLKAIRADPRTRNVPVVMTTSSHEEPDIRTAYELGANSYVVKTVDLEAFAEIMADVGSYWLFVNLPYRQ